MQINTVHNGDALEILRTLPDNSIDSVVTDPPYGISFMQRNWDTFAGNQEYAQWVEQWARECLRVLKPGGHLLAFSGTRTYHALAWGVESAGFEIRDMIEWLYLSGFPKSMDVGKQFDKHAGTIGRNTIELKKRLIELFKKSGKTGKQVDEECGFRAMNYLTLPKEGKRPDPWVHVLPSQEKWQVMKKVLGAGDELDEIFKAAEREKIGEYQKLDTFVRDGGYVAGEANVEQYDRKTIDITAPATPLAKQWSGWGTSLKPSHETLVYARKPFIPIPLLVEVDNLMEAMLCLLLLRANSVVNNLQSNLPVQSVESIFAVVNASVNRGIKSGALNDTTGIFNSPEMESMFWNIVMSWNNILVESCDRMSTFTTSMVTNLITALKTLKSLLSPIIPENIIQDVTNLNGQLSRVNTAENNSSDGQKNTNDIQKRIAAVIATWQTSENGTPANIAANNLHLIIPSVNSVLANVMTDTGASNLKNAHSPIVMARKPLIGTVCANVEQYGTGAINVDGCRIPTDDDTARTQRVSGTFSAHNFDGIVKTGGDNGRFPANCITTDNDAWYSKYFGIAQGSAVANVTPQEISKKASKKDRNSTWDGRQIEGTNKHPTVKNVELMSWLIKLVTPPNGIVLDPFAGSGSTLVAAKREGFSYIGIEREQEYIDIIHKRLA